MSNALKDLYLIKILLYLIIIITLNTTYGIFNYKVSKTKIVNEDDVDEVPVKKDKEVLMLYTCWPINNIGHASQRYVVYADLVK